MLNFDAKNKIYFNIGLFLVIILLPLCLLFYPSVKKIKSMALEVGTMENDLEQKNLNGQNLKDAALKIKNYAPRLAKADEFFIKEERKLDFITLLEEKAQNNNIESKFEFKDAEEDNLTFYKKSRLIITANGELPDLMNYLADLEGLNYYLNISDIKLAGQTAKENQKNINLQIIADIYWKK